MDVFKYKPGDTVWVDCGMLVYEAVVRSVNGSFSAHKQSLAYNLDLNVDGENVRSIRLEEYISSSKEEAEKKANEYRIKAQKA